ncbi:MAG: TIGR00303 family protein [Synergistaceae bacterium]
MFKFFISETELSRVPGLSAAGANVDVIPYTAPADADMLFYDRPRIIDCVPLDPMGHPTPALVTKAAILEGKFPVSVVRVGSSLAPVAPHLEVSSVIGKDPRNGVAVAVVDMKEISEKCKADAEDFVKHNDKIVIAESIPGGTTTALMLLRSLGYDGMVSSAGPVNPLSIKEEIWNDVSRRLGIKMGGLKGKGLAAAAEVGDPMQVAVASFVTALPKRFNVTLAGGTQMEAVAALIRDMGDTRDMTVATTKYVAEDKSGCFKDYAEKIGVDWYAAPLDFSNSEFKGLRDYEIGYVKEGVGMGGAVRYAIECGATMENILKRCDDLYASLIA